MNNPVKATVITAAVVVAMLLAAAIYVLLAERATPSPGGEAEPASVTRSNSHVLDAGGEGAVTVVEFLDFECEACGAFYPVVEDIRETFDGEITYVVRYFPLPGHRNSMNAALAAEAAAAQGRFEDMYHRLFETQAQWGEAEESQADLFRTFAEELGLDMGTYDAAISNPETRARVDMDLNEGLTLGVSSTPTFFVDGKRLELQRWNDLEDAIATALGATQ